MKIKDLEVYKELDCENKWTDSNLIVKHKNHKLIAYCLEKNRGVFLVQSSRVLFGFEYFRVKDKRFNKEKYNWQIWPLKRKEALKKIQSTIKDKKKILLPKKIINEIVADEL